jgi:heme exporter protein A
MTEAAFPAFRLVADGVSARRGGRIAFAGASLTLVPGDIFLLRGPNGAGKSTFLRLLAGRSKPEAGTIRLEGGDIFGSTTLLGHADGLKAALTADESLGFWRDLYGANDARVSSAAAAMDIGLFRRQRASTLSAGQRRRVAHCRPIISARPIWLLDEPTAGMDAASVARVVAAIEAHARSGGAAVIATHEPLGFSRAGFVTMAEAA